MSYSLATWNPLVDSSPRSERVVVPIQFEHGLGDTYELMRSRQIPSQQRDDSIDLTVEYCERLYRVGHGKRHLGRSRTLGNLSAQERKALVAQRRCATHRVDGEQVLIAEPEARDPPSQRDRISNACVADPSMDLEQLLDGRQQLSRRSNGCFGCDRVDHRSGLTRPLDRATG